MAGRNWLLVSVAMLTRGSASVAAVRVFMQSRRCMWQSFLWIPHPSQHLRAQVARCLWRRATSRPATCVGIGSLAFLGHYADTAGGHLAGTVHAQLVDHAGARNQVGGLAFVQARDME